MNVDEKHRLNFNRTQLRRDVVASQVLPQLLQDEVLSADDAQRVRLAGTDYQQIDTLLDMLPTKGPQAYKSFRRALVGQYDWLVEALDKTECRKESETVEMLMCKEVNRDMLFAMKKNARLVSRWKSLATRLGLTARIPSIEYKVRVNAEELDQCIDYVLQDWQGSAGSQATVGALVKALQVELFNDVAELISDIACES